jgi:hypothetical protein
MNSSETDLKSWMVSAKMPRRGSNLLLPEEQLAVHTFISDQQTNGLTGGAEIDPQWFVGEGKDEQDHMMRLMCFMLYYFPGSFKTWEPINDAFFRFLEYETKGLCWLPGQHGKTTMIQRWFIYVDCCEPEISCIYTEKNQPTANKRARGTRMQMEENKLLIRDFGIFKPEPSSSKPWSDEQMTIRQRQDVRDTPTLAVFGAGGASLLGNRCNILIVDDPVTPENSRSEKERGNLKQWHDEAASTSPYPLPIKTARYLVKEFLVGTVFRRDDLFHTALETGQYAFLHLKSVTDEVNGKVLSSRFCFIDPSELKVRAQTSQYYRELLHLTQTKQVRNLYEWMQAHGRRAFNRRYQNVAISEEDQWCREEWIMGGKTDEGVTYPGCINKKRSLGQISNPGEEKKDWIVVTGCDPQSGSKGRGAKRMGLVTLAANPKEPHRIRLVDLDFGQYPLDSDNPGKITQVKLLVDHYKNYHPRYVVIEDNAQQAGWADTLRATGARMGLTIPAVGHHTDSTNKVDEDMGVESMAPMIENGYLDLPFATPSDQRKVQALIDEIIFWQAHPTSDLVMAMWFAWVRLTKLLKGQAEQTQVVVHEREYINRRSTWVFPDWWSEEMVKDWKARAEGRHSEEQVA